MLRCLWIVVDLQYLSGMNKHSGSSSCFYLMEVGIWRWYSFFIFPQFFLPVAQFFLLVATGVANLQSILKEISPGISMGGMMLKLKLQYFGHLLWRVDSLEKTDAGRDWGQEEKGMTEVEMAGWHHGLDGHEFEWTLGIGDGQGGLACCNSWGRKESDMTERLNWTDLNWII